MSTQTRIIEGFREACPVDQELLPDSPPVLDPAPLRSLRALESVAGSGLVVEIVEAFLDSVPQSLRALRGAAVRGDSATVERLAHSLRGSCGIVGARRMADRAAAIERRAWSPEDEGAEDFHGLETEWRVVEAALTAVAPGSIEKLGIAAH